LPIHIGGGGPPALRRAAQLGDGWYGETHVIPEIERLRAEAGRADLPFEYSTISLGTVSNEELAALAEQGVHRVVVTPWPGRRVGEVGLEGLADIERYANEVGLST
jgi:alkanesulfonate monooxygenase SsuD/methylene tetrahydromethanopterin reductase-like flavin-dependent oxidoreductase (luciferase family)